MHRLDGNPVLRKMLTALFMAGVVVALPSVVEAQSLGGSKASMDRQNQQARAHDFTFLRDGNQVRTFANSGLLVRLTGDDNYQLAGVSYPYARPEVKLFVERLSSQFRAACGEQLVITSLTRATHPCDPSIPPGWRLISAATTHRHAADGWNGCCCH